MTAHDRRALFGQALDLIRQVPEPAERDLVTAAILALSERLLSDEETAKLVKELSAMSKILDEVKQQGRDEGREEVARAMLAEGDPIEKIMRVTGLTREQVLVLRGRQD